MLRQYRSSAETAVRSQHTASSVSMTHRRESVGCAQLLYLSWRLRVASCAELATYAPCRLRESSPQPCAYEPHDLPAELRKHAICFSDAAACSECRLDHKHCLSGSADSPAVLGLCAALRFAPVLMHCPLMDCAHGSATVRWPHHVPKPPVGIEPTTIRLRSACSAS